MLTLFPGAGHLQNIHPLTVHFPIAFLAGAVLLYLLAWLLRKDHLAVTAFTCLALGALAALASVGTGLMLWTASLAVVLAAWAAIARPFPSKGRPLFFFLLLAMLVIMAFGSDYGARMVYDYNAGGNACPQPIEFSQ